MNKKIKTILFTLFVAGLLTVSCSSKDKTGPSSDNGGGTTGLPTVTITDGEGVGSSYRQYKYTSSSTYKLVLTLNGGQTQELSSETDFILSTSSKDPNLQEANEGGILIKMPKLTELGFTSDLIRIPAKNIVHGAYGYDIHTLYVFSNTDEKLEYVELKAQNVKIATFLEIDEVGITLTKTTKLKDQDAVTETYNIKGRPKFAQSSNGVTAIDGTPVDPNY
ncbi:hypothetical protein [Brachyspira pulli]|uniref:hypothetical protein n=1 Tax=Brachyspira pulli TaxID=310721 RepID=UPI003004A330